MSFKTWLENTERVLYLIRGPSGTGKSTLSATLGGEVFSTDDFFGKDPEEYRQNFSTQKLPEAHAWNIERAADAMRRGVSPIIVDNTFVEAWEMKPYVMNADKFGYQVMIREPSGDWQQIKDMMASNDHAGLSTAARELARRNKHGVPPKRIKDMFQQWQSDPSLDQIRTSRAPWEQRD